MLSHNQPRVLCVDDDEDACEMLKMLMKAQGIDATCSQSAAEAWLRIKAECFDLYLLDGWLPRMNGFDFCRQIREFDPNTPILFYSGAAYDADRQKGIAAGANAYVIKPNVDGLIDTILDLIAKAKSNDVVTQRVTNRPPPARISLGAPLLSLNTPGI